MKKLLVKLFFLVCLISCKEYDVSKDFILPIDNNQMKIGSENFPIYDGSIGESCPNIALCKSKIYVLFSGIKIDFNKNQTKLLLKGYVNNDLKFVITELRKDSLIKNDTEISSIYFIAAKPLEYFNLDNMLNINGEVVDTLHKKSLNFNLKKELHK
jgi:hypothetical protein